MSATGDLIYADAVPELMEAFPELEAPYLKAFSHYEGEQPGAHVVYWDLFCPFMAEQLSGDDSKAKRRLAEFLARLAVSRDSRVRDLFGLTVQSYLEEDPSRLRSARKCALRYSWRLAWALR